MKKTLMLLGSFLLAGTAIAKEAPAIESRVLLKATSSWDGTPYKAYPTGQPELSIVNIKIPPNSALQWHQHPMPNAVYLASGQLEIQIQNTDKTIQLKAGDTLAEVEHIIHRGVTGDSHAELIVFYAGTPGMPLSH